jgi:hypothetical protein
MVRERCACGAEFESDQSNAMKLIKEWRQEHLCVYLPGGHPAGNATAQVELSLDYREPELHIGFRPINE